MTILEGITSKHEFRLRVASWRQMTMRHFCSWIVLALLYLVMIRLWRPGQHWHGSFHGIWWQTSKTSSRSTRWVVSASYKQGYKFYKLQPLRIVFFFNPQLHICFRPFIGAPFHSVQKTNDMAHLVPKIARSKDWFPCCPAPSCQLEPGVVSAWYASRTDRNDVLHTYLMLSKSR